LTSKIETANREKSESPSVKTGVILSDSVETSQNNEAVQPAISMVPALEETTVESHGSHVVESKDSASDVKKRQAMSNKKPHKKREEWDKEGKYKYINRRLKEMHEDIRRVMRLQGFIIKGLEHEFLFSQDLLENQVSKDDVDRHILSELGASSRDGILPRDIARSVGLRSVTPKKVTQRIRQLNKRMQSLFGQNVAEKRGMTWAMTDWMRDSWGEKVKV
jgi:hypothetical protein